MQLKVNEVQLPAPLTFNYEELKQELIQKAESYASLVYTEDQIKVAKEDRANLNRLKKALNDERLKREKEYMAPFATFKAQINEIISIIDKPCAVIDQQVKAFEERQKAEKKQSIEAYWQEVLQADKVPSAVCFSTIFEEKWLNASVSMKSIREAIDTKISQIDQDLSVIRGLPSYAFEAEQVYLSSFSLSNAVSEAHRLQEMADKKAAWEAEKARVKEEAKQLEPVNYGYSKPEEPVKETADPVRQWIGFQAFLTVEEAKSLCMYLKANGIKYKSI